MSASKPRYLPGDKVVVSSSYEYSDAWRGQEMTVVAVSIAPDLTSRTYTVAEAVHRGRWSGLSDEWKEEDLSPVSATVEAEHDELRARIAEQQSDGTLMTPDQKLAWDAAFRRVFAVLDNSTSSQKTVV